MKRTILFLCMFAAAFVGCRSKPSSSVPFPGKTAAQAPILPTEQKTNGLSPNEIESLHSLELVDNYPLYIMEYTGGYSQRTSTGSEVVYQEYAIPESSWACTLFAALADEDNRLYGRNFDWEYSPALLLFTNPPDGYASVSIIDIAYLGFSGDEAARLDELPLDERMALLEAPWWPFDGMNEHGLAIGMAAVPSGDMIDDPQKVTVDSLEIMRIILDGARNVDEAIEIFSRYNIEMSYGPDLHYLIADRTGRAVLIEFFNGEMHVMPNEHPWHLATNFLCSAISGPLRGKCLRYDLVLHEFEESGGYVELDEAITLLGMVAQAGTQWSVVYGMSTGSVEIVIGQEFSDVHTFQLNLEEE